MTFGHRVRNRQPLGGVPRRRHVAGERVDVALALGGLCPRDALQKRLRVGVFGRLEQRLYVRDLDEFAQVHHRDAVADVPDHREVVRDEEIGEAEVVLQIRQQVEDLRLHGDVERARRFVEYQEVGFDGEGAGDADPLALAAGELPGVALEVFGCQTDAFEQVLYPVAAQLFV